MAKRKLDIATLKEWVELAKNTRKTRTTLGQLSVVDFYRFLYPNREPRCKRYYARGCIHGFKKHFYRWGHDIWNPWARTNQDELRLFLKNFSLGGCGIILYFKAKELRNYQIVAKYISEHSTILPINLQENIGISKDSAYHYLRLLFNKGLIHHCQPRIHGKPQYIKKPWWDEEKAIAIFREYDRERVKKYGNYK